MNSDLWTFLEDHAALTPDKTLLRYPGVDESYNAFAQSAARAADALYDLGVRAGDNVCVMLGNHPDYLHIWLGLARLGAVVVPINVHLKGEGLGYIIEHSGAKLLIVESELVERIFALPAPPSALTTIVVRGSAPASSRCLDWDALVATDWPSSPRVKIAPDAVASILYTSGTTGPPKGVMLSHAAYLNSAHSFAEEMVHATSDDVLFTTLPLFHINAQAHTVLPAIHLNATMAISPRFSASSFWNEIRQSRATIFNSLAAMIPILCKQPASPDDRRHNARLTACAATPKDVWLQFEERFGVTIVEGYGLTETAGFCVTNPLDNTRVGSIGQAMSWVETRVVDPADHDMPIGKVGEIAIRPSAPHVLMEGYYKMPEQTTEAMRGGWFHSGDAGQLDPDGFLYFVDRIKQSIRRRGENISSWEVEKIVNAHPKVLESAAVGVPSELGEEDVKVCVVARPGETIDPVEVIQWCETRMAYFMVPRYVALRESLPKTATERVEKYKLKQEGVANAWDREVAGYRLRRG